MDASFKTILKNNIFCIVTKEFSNFYDLIKNISKVKEWNNGISSAIFTWYKEYIVNIQFEQKGVKTTKTERLLS